MIIDFTYKISISVPDGTTLPGDVDDLYISEPNFLSDGDEVKLGDSFTPWVDEVKGTVLSCDCDKAQLREVT